LKRQKPIDDLIDVLCGCSIGRTPRSAGTRFVGRRLRRPLIAELPTLLQGEPEELPAARGAAG
jgi:hypothetical protein